MFIVNTLHVGEGHCAERISTGSSVVQIQKKLEGRFIRAIKQMFVRGFATREYGEVAKAVAELPHSKLNRLAVRPAVYSVRRNGNVGAMASSIW